MSLLSHRAGSRARSPREFVARPAARAPLDGAARRHGTRVTLHDFIVFDNDAERVVVEADGEVQLLVMSGEPIDEPVVQYGPFVMNTQQEVLQAFHDYQRGKFGQLYDEEA